MLICNVSLRPPRTAIAAQLAEAATATDATATGFVVFATLVDDPASIGDIVDAYLGEIMLEAASADDVTDAGLALVSAIDEAVAAADTQDAAIIGAVITRQTMLRGVFVNSGTVSRASNVNGIMLNL